MHYGESGRKRTAIDLGLHLMCVRVDSVYRTNGDHSRFVTD